MLFDGPIQAMSAVEALAGSRDRSVLEKLSAWACLLDQKPWWMSGHGVPVPSVRSLSTDTLASTIGWATPRCLYRVTTSSSPSCASLAAPPCNLAGVALQQDEGARARTTTVYLPGTQVAVE